MKRTIGFVLLIAATAGMARAQYSTKGFSLRPHVVGVAWAMDEFEEDAQGGGGLGLGLSFGFTEAVSMYVELAGAEISPETGDPYALVHADLGMRFLLGRHHSPLRFALNVGVNARAAELDQPTLDIEAAGTGATAGAGVIYFTTSNFGIEGNLQITGGKMTEIEVNGVTWEPDYDAVSARLNLGVFWYPGR